MQHERWRRQKDDEQRKTRIRDGKMGMKKKRILFYSILLLSFKKVVSVRETGKRRQVEDEMEETRRRRLMKIQAQEQNEIQRKMLRDLGEATKKGNKF